ncbi:MULTISPECIES: hypothetical protein [unclassified Planococcus (in: firmicutes)]|uniref:hypothetical protein n=1 Tax=Planococcus TaxID=1372 RepID=UPI000C3429D0|nr:MULTISPECIES: hypothetical protein [unclassified Planococcus (in: firmicutes)]AUD15093.1 hypothetical protein CW734_17205 [Planococcus sp. MB-3u-03]PKG46225.1 hypothetical protein CXF66_07505 [Planococcus sp. Urea-trap-24]PKG90011.1 hypothetical protein CXF91_03850 [Planococcus sp. Urea-3u-39]PKH35723.1 hypothetical protein CXF77_16280 [Planococcus sp. MB-3u-09]
MNDGMIAYLLKSEVAKLGEEQRQLYRFIIELEDALAEQADTVEEFRRLLVLHSPFEQAAYRFNRSLKEIATMMQQIEAELGDKIEARRERAKWLDYTDRFAGEAGQEDKQVFLFISE